MIALRRSGLGRKQKRDTSTNPDVNLDIGATLTVDAWHDGRARVQYRGADWDVELANGERDDAHGTASAPCVATVWSSSRKPRADRPPIKQGGNISWIR
jgi:hypothetical protein